MSLRELLREVPEVFTPLGCAERPGGLTFDGGEDLAGQQRGQHQRGDQLLHSAWTVTQRAHLKGNSSAYNGPVLMCQGRLNGLNGPAHTLEMIEAWLAAVLDEAGCHVESGC